MGGPILHLTKDYEGGQKMSVIEELLVLGNGEVRSFRI